MSYLQNQANAFKKRLANQQIISKPVISKPPRNATYSPATTPSPSKPTSHNVITPKKRKKPTITYSQPLDTGVGEHIASKYLFVLEYLKERDEEMHIGELASKSGVDILGNSDLLHMIQKSERVVYDDINKTIRYRPDYPIRSKEELIGLLEAQFYGRNPLPPSILAQRAANTGTIRANLEKRLGLPYSALKESWASVGPSIQELEKEDYILVTRAVKDNTMRMVYWNEVPYIEMDDGQRKRLHVDQEFKDIWNSIKIPDDVELPKELEKAGLKTAQTNQSAIKNTKDQKKPKQKSRRRQKITNTHMLGVVQSIVK